VRYRTKNIFLSILVFLGADYRKFDKNAACIQTSDVYNAVCDAHVISNLMIA